MEKKRAILVVSFGTSYEETRKKTIDQIEADIHAKYPQYPLYRAWTSKMIMKKILKRDGIRILNVREAMERMKADGMEEVVVQPTHILNGIENDLMTADIQAYRDQFSKIEIGTPLLTSREDEERVAGEMAGVLNPDKDEALIFMGHGTEHFSNSIYAALDYRFKDMGYPNIFMGTVEAYPAIDSLVKKMRELHYKRIVLTPFMIVAGDHANNDLAGEEEDSWKSIFEKEGFEVSCIIKGLGEYPGIREIFCEHVEASLKSMDEGV